MLEKEQYLTADSCLSVVTVHLSRSAQKRSTVLQRECWENKAAWLGTICVCRIFSARPISKLGLKLTEFEVV
jgi:hypothetical protein